jgi:sporulation protein YlmC with PRC-barrel domain
MRQAEANTGTKHMMRSTSTATLAICSLLASLTPLFAASPTSAPALSGPPPAVSTPAASSHPAEKCLGDVKAFSEKMSKDGYWLGGSGYGYGYPMGGYGYGYGAGYGVPLGNLPAGNAAGYGSARPGYEIRTLMASATVLAQMGQEQECQTVLATSQAIYTRYESDLRARGIRSADMPGWRHRQIAAAEPVLGADASFRSDQLLDTDVVSAGNETLGSVHDLVLDPHTGKIAYLIISRGGLFGIDASYVPVPWGALKAAPNASLLVLDTTKAAMSAAPQVSDHQFSDSGQFDQESKKVDAYWGSRVKTLAATN